MSGLETEARKRDAPDGQLARAMVPVVEDAVRLSAAERPRTLSDALFPIMGPAIRKAIGHALAGMMQSLNQTLEHAFSVQGLKWRLDAIRTGKSFAEIVMLNTLVYRVEQVFLIHRETGLLIHHVASDKKFEEDADVISGMLTAVRDFVRDSFAGETDDEIESLRMGELELWVAQGPDLVLALACRGTLPAEVFTRMQEVVEWAQGRFARALEGFDGDTSAFAEADEPLRELLVARYSAAEGKRSPAKAYLALGSVAGLLIVWLGHAWLVRHRWEAFVEDVSGSPGIVVLRVDADGPPFRMWGLRDPLAPDPAGRLAIHGLRPDDVTMRWRPYHSLLPEFVIRRIRQRLAPPEGVTLRLDGGVLRVAGKAMPDWARRMRILAAALPGVDRVDASKLQVIDVDALLLARIRQRLAPPESVHLSLQDRVLHVAGRARDGWARSAREAIRTFKELRGYDARELIVVDDPARLLAEAKRRLRPPATVRLRVDAKRRLHASGLASGDWIRKARRLAGTIPYVTGYDDRGLRTPARKPTDDEILRAARAALAPPPTVHLEVRAGRLQARGFASAAWIAKAREQAMRVPGVVAYDDAKLENADVPWEAARRKLRGMEVRYDFRTANPRPGEAARLGEVAGLAKRAMRLRPGTRLTVLGLSQSSGERQRRDARRFAADAARRLAALGVRPEAMEREVATQRGSRRISGVRFDLREPAP